MSITKIVNITPVRALGATLSDPRVYGSKVAEVITTLNQVIDELQGSYANPLIISDTTQSTSKDTGALIVDGGVGVEKDVYIGGILNVLTGVNLATVSGVTTIGSTTALTISAAGLETINNTTDATAYNATASLQTLGGLAVAKKAYIGTILTVIGQSILAAGTVSAPGAVVGANDNGFYEISSSQLGVSIGNTLVGGFDSVGMFTSRISEQVALAGITYVGQDIKSASAGLTALAGGAQAGTALTKTYNEFTTVATAADSAQLPVSALGKKVVVKNSAAKAMAVFGQTGDAIDGASVNASFSVGPGQEVIFEGVTSTTWQTKDGTSLGTISSVTQATSITTGVTVNSKKGIITTFTPSTAALAATTFTVTCSKTTATSHIRAYVTEYGGTVITNGLPYVFVKNQTATAFDIIIYNAHATNALATSMKIGFEIIN